ncbi:MAG: nitroreductase family protein [Planctomycetota bacterium]|jgi:nitroreductase|nr:nitroreductase family protein [Planctomycetota bacterium]
MNEVLTAIRARRSVRKLKPDPIPDHLRDLIVESGLYAPSAKNAQAWHITVVQNPGLIDRITAEVKAAIIRRNVERYIPLANNPEYTVNFGGSTFMILSIDPAATPCPAEDTGAALENMFLAAHSLGIASCWINQLGPVADDPAMRALLTGLGVPGRNVIFGCATFGYGATAAPAVPPRKEGTVNIVK